MKENILLGLLLTLVCLNQTSAEGLDLSASDEGIVDSISKGLPTPYSDEEMAAPPSGEIQKKYLRDVNASRAGLEVLLRQVPAGPDGRESPIFAKLQTIKAGLDQLASSRLESQLFGLVPILSEVYAAETEGAPQFVCDSIGWLQNISPMILHAAASHIIRKNANVEAGNVSHFVRIFAAPHGFVSAGDWEDEPMPIQSSGVMILDASGVVAQLKAGPWKQAKQFLGGASNASVYFSRYSSDGIGMAELKTKYAQNKVAIDAGFVELQKWVAQQEASCGSP